MQDIQQAGASAAAANDADHRGRGVPDRRRGSAGPLSQVLRPFTRTGGFYARSWGRYLDREPDELPVARPTISLATQAFLDEIVLVGLRSVRPVSADPDAVAQVRGEVIAALELYGQKGWLQNPAGFFATPPPLTDVTVRPVQTPGAQLRAHLLRQRVPAACRRTGPGPVAGLHRQRPGVRVDAATPRATAMAGVCARRPDGPGRPRSHLV